MTFELSPSLADPSVPGAPGADAFELKFHLPAAAAPKVEAWARYRLRPDPHGEEGTYLITSLYCDTPRLDVFHRSPGYRRSKFRLRRYESMETIYLERKRRRGDRVEKRRYAVSLGELPLLGGTDVPDEWPGLWFFRQARFRELRPTCLVAYRRTAFQGSSPSGPIRLTMDRGVIGVPAHDWHVPSLEGGKLLLSTSIILELKFRAAVPGLFRELLEEMPPTMGRISKYRLCVETWGLAGGTS
jgi:hypothetical protein